MVEEDREHDNFDEVADIARRSYKLVKQVMGELNVEYKILEQFAVAFQPTYGNAGGNTMILMNSCSQGVTDDSRTGDRIKISNFFMSGRIEANVAPGAGRSYLVRCIVYWQPGPDTVTLQFPTTGGSQDGLLDAMYNLSSFAVVAPKDYDQTAKTEILWDHTWAVSTQGNVGGIHHFRKLIKIMRHTQFEDNTVNSSTINNGVLRVCWVSDAAAADNSRPLVNYLSRVYFVDN